MLTPYDIENKRFKKGLMGGYSIDEVEEFLEKVLADYTQIYKDNAQLSKKLSTVVEKIDEYREQEETLMNTMIQSQRLSDNLIKDAKTRSEIIIHDAEFKAGKILSAAEGKLDEEIAQANAINGQTAKFKDQLLSMYKEQISLILDIPVPEDIQSPSRQTEVEQKPVQDDETIAFDGNMQESGEPQFANDDEDNTIVRRFETGGEALPQGAEATEESENNGNNGSNDTNTYSPETMNTIEAAYEPDITGVINEIFPEDMQ